MNHLYSIVRREASARERDSSGRPVFWGILPQKTGLERIARPARSAGLAQKPYYLLIARSLIYKLSTHKTRNSILAIFVGKHDYIQTRRQSRSIEHNYIFALL